MNAHDARAQFDADELAVLDAYLAESAARKLGIESAPASPADANTSPVRDGADGEAPLPRTTYEELSLERDVDSGPYCHHCWSEGCAVCEREEADDLGTHVERVPVTRCAECSGVVTCDTGRMRVRGETREHVCGECCTGELVALAVELEDAVRCRPIGDAEVAVGYLERACRDAAAEARSLAASERARNGMLAAALKAERAERDKAGAAS